MREYESPKFEFQELKLFERVAETCWGTASIWLDTNGDSIISNIDIQLSTGGGCQGNASATAINNAIAEFNRIVDAYAARRWDEVVKYNPDLANYLQERPGTTLNKITATADSNWANTKESSGGGIIIDRS